MNCNDVDLFTVERVKEHNGHEIECAVYGALEDPVNVSVECVDCWEVIVSFDKEDDDQHDCYIEYLMHRGHKVVSDARGLFCETCKEILYNINVDVTPEM